MDVFDWLTKILHFGAQVPGLSALVIGNISAWALGALVEAYALPPTMPIRKQRGWASLVTIFGACCAAALTWGVLVPGDPAGLRWVIAGVVAPTAPFSYIIAGQVLTKFFPKIASSWVPPP